MQTQIRKRDTYEEGIGTLFDLRNQLMETLLSLNNELDREDFDAIPFIILTSRNFTTQKCSEPRTSRFSLVLCSILIAAHKVI